MRAAAPVRRFDPPSSSLGLERFATWAYLMATRRQLELAERVERGERQELVRDALARRFG